MGKGSHNYAENRKYDADAHDTNNETSTETINANDILNNLPTLSTIKKAIPAECFESNVFKSMAYVVKDVVLVAILYTTLVYIEKLNFNWILYAFIVYPLYWFWQGTMFTSIFVLGHDCGHGSFSRYSWLNDVMGTLLHTFILAPYYPW